MVSTAGKNLASPETLSGNTPTKLMTRKTADEIPQQKTKIFPAQDETLQLLECKYAVKIDSNNEKNHNYNFFQFFLNN